MAIIHHIAKTMFTLIFFLLTLVMQLALKGIVALAQTLPEDELSALREISTQLRKLDWNFDENPCDDNSSSRLSWASPTLDSYENNVICNCTLSNSECHVVSITLKGQDLAGILPPSLAKLPYIKTIDLTRNYLNGTIPREWASTSLEYLAIPVNRLSGPIPDYVGNITTLKHLSIEGNQFSGTLPPGLGKLVNLENLTMKCNYLTGELPLELRNMVKLKIVRISSNNFTGKIPNFFRNWKELEKLEMQASGLEGPIPDDISVLTNLTELRISDLNGEGSAFPLLKSMTRMNNLILRSCKINGSIPPYITAMAQLNSVDLSFNMLTGNVPDSITASKLYLTKNLLNGSIPSELTHKDNTYQLDLSYNHFPESSIPTSCPDSVNFYRSSSGGNQSELRECLTNFPCSKDLYQLYINCGGKNITIGDTNFEGDEDQGQAVKFKPSKVNWGFSSTGRFLDQSTNQEFFMAQNVSILRMNNSELYTTARVSPLSLTYYGRCLANGNYTVKLHFAEIIFRSNKSFQSLGRRIFDVYIQEDLVLKDFNIETEAGDVDKVVVRNFTAVVTHKTLEIRFYWAGKGTTMIPKRGIYGPLISAISVESVSPPPAEQSTGKSHDGRRKIVIVVGAVALVLCGILVLLDVFWWKICLGHKTSMEQDLRGLDLQTGFFTYRQIKAATNNFNGANKIGQGGFGSVYKGTLLDGTTIAVKQLSSLSKQGNREFVNEIGMISGLQHPNLVRLYGCCVEKRQLLLVYEYMENNSLARALFGPEECRLNLDWPTRQRICIGIARGLAFLHEESVLRIVHRDIKATNVLLDKDLNPKISDFGLAKLDEEENSHISTRVAGTVGYMAPEYALWGHLTYKADVFSFGVVALEIVAGKNNRKYQPNEEYVCLLDWAPVLQQKGCLTELIDPSLGSEFNKEEANRMIKVAMLCTNPSSALRPTMSAVVSMLEGQTDVPELIMDSSVYGDELRFRAFRGQNDQMRVGFSESQALEHLSDQTSTQDLYPVGSSSTQDLYPITNGSQ